MKGAVGEGGEIQEWGRNWGEVKWRGPYTLIKWQSETFVRPDITSRTVENRGTKPVVDRKSILTLIENQKFILL